MALKYSHLKQAICIQDGCDFETPRYIIENQNDIIEFGKIFPVFINILKDKFNKIIEEGVVILVTDVHPMSGFNTWCTEHELGLKRKENE